MALAPVPADSALSDLERARGLVAVAEGFRNPIDAFQLLRATSRAPATAPDRAQVDAVQLQAFELALTVASEHASLAFHAQSGWLDALRAGLLAVLRFFDEEPALASYLVVHSAQAGERVLARRAELLYRIAVLLDDEQAPSRIFPPPLTAQAVASGVLGVVHDRLVQQASSPLADLAGELMSFIALPFLGARVAHRELDADRVAARGSDTAAVPGASEEATLDLVRGVAGRVNTRTLSVLAVIAADPGLNSRQLAARAAIKDQGHASRLFTRLERLGVIENAADRGSRFAPKAWRLTTAGVNLRASLDRGASKPACAPDLPPEYVGRLDDNTVALLRALAERPWMRTAEAGARAQLPPYANPARLLQSLADLDLARGELETHGRGTPKAWTLTTAGERLHATLTGEPPSPRSVAADLMHASGGRLGDTLIAVLRLLGSEAGLSNNEIAARLRLTDENATSQLLSRLARRELIGNARAAGRQNVWHLTGAGEKLERAIWGETPVSEQRRVALDLLRDRGGRLNHRAVTILRAIGSTPGLSNAEIAERVGIQSKGHASTLLSRLVRFGLIENVLADPGPFQPNAWRLTAFGRQLNAATRDAGRTASSRSSRSTRRTPTGECA
jgi:DNA-binding MarR family transcriptional regulator